MGREFRTDGIWDRCDYGGSRARPARLGILQEIWIAGAGGCAAVRGRSARCRKNGGGVRRARAGEARQFGTIQRACSRRSDRENGGVRGRKRVWARGDYFQAEGLGCLAAAVLGHADSGGLLFEGRHGASTGQRFAGAPAAESKTDGHGRIAAGVHARVREYHLPEMRRAGAARDGHHGYIRGLLLVFLPLRRRAQRQGALRLSEGCLLVSDRSVHRRNHARDSAPAVFTVLVQGDARPGIDKAQRAGGAALYTGDGAKGRRGHVQVAGQRGRRGRDGAKVRSGYGEALHTFCRASGERFGVERGEHRRLLEISESRLPAGGPPRLGHTESEKRKRPCRDGFSEGKDSSAQSAPNTAAGDAGLRDTLALQFCDCAGHGADQRDLFAGAAGKRGAAGSSQGSAGTADADAGTDDPASRGRAMGNAGTHRRIVDGALAEI